MRSVPARAAAAVCGLTCLSLLPGGSPAQASAATPAQSWQIVADLPQPSGIGQLGDVVALGPGNAWASGTNGTPLIEHWTGASWQDVTPTGAQFQTPGDSADAIGATSSTNVWAMVGSVTNGYAMRWNGSSWTKYSFHQYLTDCGIAVESRKDVWVFASTGSFGPFARRFNGHRWIKFTLPATPLAESSVSWNDIYAVGPTVASAGGSSFGPARDVLMRWNGKAWSSVKFPGLRMTKAEQFAPVGVVATRTDGVWITGDVQRASGGGQVLRHRLLHWTGKRWQVFGSPVSLGLITTDGAGGLWMTDLTTGAPESFVHFGGGAWQLTAVPLPPSPVPAPAALMSSITVIPGTTSVWAVGTFVTDGYDAIIDRYGP
jgi:hypothetical protein